MKYYAVFDTNVLVSSLLTKRTDTATAMVVDAISTGEIIPFYNKRTYFYNTSFFLTAIQPTTINEQISKNEQKHKTN